MAALGGTPLGSTMTPGSVAVTVARAACGLVTLGAITVQVVHGATHPPFDAADFFSYFTVQSNAFAAVLLLAGAVRRGRRGPAALDRLRGAAVVYMVVTGVVYAVLLAGGRSDLLPWVNTWLHRVMPIVVAGDWVLVPPASRIGAGRALVWLAYPLAYIVYALGRGAVVGWYPYGFVDPAGAPGYAGVARTAVVLGILIALLAVGVARLGTARSGRGAVGAPTRG